MEDLVNIPDSISEPEMLNADQDIPGSLVKDKAYFFDIIVIQVENTLFRVPKQGFMVEDSVFMDMYQLPLGTDASTADGTSLESPLILTGISVDHFRGLMRAMYPFTQTPLTYDEWVGALHLAKMWNFTEIRKRAIAHISPLLATRDVYSNILLGKKYAVRQWVMDGYAVLAAQNDIPSVEELAAKGLDGFTLARVFCLRERVRLKKPTNTDTNGHNCTNCGHRRSDTASIFGPYTPKSVPVDNTEFYKNVSRECIPSVFRAELADMPEDGAPQEINAPGFNLSTL